MAEIIGLIAALKDELLKVGGYIKDELDQCLDKGLQKYIENYESKFRYTKTFIFRDNQVDFYDIYFPLTLRYKEEKIEISDSIDDLFKQHRYITILGYAGSGKTMLLKHCFLSSLRSSGQIPIVIEFRNLNSYEGTLLNYIQQHVFRMNIAKNNNILERLLEAGKFTFLLDGFDEISLSLKERRIRELDSFIDSYVHNNYLLTSRPDANAENLQRFENYYICKLSRRQIKEFINLQVNLINDGGILERKILDLIDKRENQEYLSYLSSPLLLSMFILTFSNHPELPKQKNKFYYNVFDTLYSRHDTVSKSGGYVHEKKTSFEKDMFETVLKWFSYISFVNYKYNFDRQFLTETFQKIKDTTNLKFIIEDLIYDLSVSISVLIKDGNLYTFPHRSLQEYFTALLISGMNENVKREKIYNKTISKFGFDNEYNLWSLCEEMDRYCFVKYFLLGRLSEIISKLETSCDGNMTKESIFHNMLKLFSPQLMIVGTDFNGVRYSSSDEYRILKYLKFDLIRILLLVDSSDFKDLAECIISKHLDIAKNEDEFDFDCQTEDSDIRKLYNRCKFYDKGYELYLKIKDRKTQLENMLEKENENNMSLLNFSCSKF